MTSDLAMKVALDALLRVQPQVRGVLPQQDVEYAIGALNAALAPQPPWEAQTEAEKIAYAAGWYKALEMQAKEGR